MHPVCKEHIVCAVATGTATSRACARPGCLAAKDGFYFSSAKVKAVYQQLTANPKAELCLYAPPGCPPSAKEGMMNIGKAMRVSGVVAFLGDPKLRERLLEERSFLRPNAENVAIFRVEKGDAWFWTFATASVSLQLNDLFLAELRKKETRDRLGAK